MNDEAFSRFKSVINEGGGGREGEQNLELWGGKIPA